MRDGRRATKLALALVAAVLGVSSCAGPWPDSAHAARQEKTLGQTGKNVKVLTDLPESQTFLVMNFISASLGVRCDYCHVNGGGDKWVWESDARDDGEADYLERDGVPLRDLPEGPGQVA